MKQPAMNHNEIEIIQFLFDKQGDYIPSKEIALQLNLSDKPVRKYIQNLFTLVVQYGANIEMKKGSGYQLHVEDHQTFYQLMEFIKNQRFDVEGSNLLTDSEDRERFILNAILLENQQVTIDDLVDRMFISRSTVSNLVQVIKSRIKSFRLNVTYDQDGFVTISGDEMDKRRFILNYFYTTKSVDYINSELFDYEFEGFSMETIFIIVLEICREFEVILSDYVLQNLVMHIALAIKRNEKGFVLENPNLETPVTYSKELFVAEKIIANIEQLLDVHFPKHEAVYIALHLKSKANNSHLLVEGEEDELEQQIMTALYRLSTLQPDQFSIDHHLILGLKVHFESLLSRLANNLTLDNPLYDEIEDKYCILLHATKQAFAIMPSLANYQVSNHEWAYILLYILAAVERHKQEMKVNVIVICATGLGSAQMIKNRLENEFAQNFHIVDVISYYQLNDRKLENVDLIISTIDISTSFYHVPVVKVSVFLNKQDVDTLNAYIHSPKSPKQSLEGEGQAKQEILALFTRYFNPHRFLVFEETITREQALEAMASRLRDIQESNFYQDLSNQIQIREQFGSLAFSHQVAFPHPAQLVGINSEIVIGVIAKGMNWDADHHNIQLIFLMSHSKIENNGLDTINNGLAEFISNQEDVNKLVQTATFDNFKRKFMENIFE